LTERAGSSTIKAHDDIREEYALPPSEIRDKMSHEFDLISANAPKEHWEGKLQESARMTHLIFLFSKYYSKIELFQIGTNASEGRHRRMEHSPNCMAGC
jgi:hypothetical protein